MNLSIKQLHRHREQICSCQGGVREGWIGIWGLADIIITKKEEEEAYRGGRRKRGEGGRKRENEKKEQMWGNILRGNFSKLLNKSGNRKKKI